MSSYETDVRRRKMRNRAKQRRIRKLKAIGALVSMMLLIVALIAGIVTIVKSNSEKKPPSAVSNNSTTKSEETEPEDTNRDFSIVQKDKLTVSDFYYYGTHFNYTASMPYEEPADGTTIKNVTTRVYKVTDIALSSAVVEADAYFEIKKDALNIKGANVIDEGLCLEQVPSGEFVIVVAIKDSLGNTRLYPLKDESGKQDLVYYTVTKDGENRKLNIKNASVKDDNGVEMTTFTISAAKCTLPDDVYDIVIDPGHGTADGGAVSDASYVDADGKQYNERDIALDYAFALKKQLEDMGYKVKLTHDGSEGKGESDANKTGWEWCFWHAFEDGNRVWNVCEAKAKYCISLHMNSAPNMKRTRGVEVYSSVRAGVRLSQLLADNIVASTNIPISGKNDSNDPDHPGVFKKRSNDDPNVDYLYMIREVAGTVTGANVIGEFQYKNSTYGGNSHYNDNYGPEAYLIEMGYITDKENLDCILTQKEKYTGAIAKSLQTDIMNMQVK